MASGSCSDRKRKIDLVRHKSACLEPNYHVGTRLS